MTITGYYVGTFEGFMVTEGYTDRNGNYVPPSRAVPNYYDDYYDYKTRITYKWNGKQYVNKAFHSGVSYYQNDYDAGRVDTERIYLAQPGKRLIGALNGVEENSVSLTKNLNNTNTLELVVDRIVDGEISSFYDLINQHYELYIPHYGWFKINEEPQIEGDGNIETKSIHAESLEIELQQYDLVDFHINTGDVDSMEYLAVDNVYEMDGFKMFHNQILFYRDTTDLEALTAAFKALPASQQTAAKVNELLQTYPRAFYNEPHGYAQVFSAWRLSKDENQNLVIDLHNYNDPEAEDYTIAEFLDMEIQRMHELSFLWLVLHEHGWKVGYIDPYVDPYSDIDDDQIPLEYKVGYFEITTQDIYSFLTQEAASYFRCIFIFDTDNCTVNAYNINNIGYDTNIFLSFHNIQNSVTRDSDRKYATVFHVEGGEELDFTEVNFGEDWIEDISYFLTTEHFSQEFIDKYNNWYNIREGRRDEFIQNSLDGRAKEKEIYELRYKVPIDGTDTEQWNTLTIPQLVEERENYETMLAEYENYIDLNGLEEFKKHFDYATYLAIKDKILSSPLDALDYVVFSFNDSQNVGGYYFKKNGEIKQYRLGNIDAAIFAKKQVNGDYIPSQDVSYNYRASATSYANQREFLDNYQYDFKTYGDMYGVEELETQLSDLKNRCELLDKAGYSVAPDNPLADPHHTAMNGLYVKLQDAVDDCRDVLEERRTQLLNAEDDREFIREENLLIKEAVDIRNPVFEFTEEELALLDKYYIHRDYTNQNIEYLAFNTPEEIIQKEKQLLADAREQLYVESHPQWNWSTTQDNLYLIPEFKEWYSSMQVGNFIRVSMRDDYQVKLRVVSITLNPLMLDTTIDLTFSSMIQYKAKRNDYLSLIDGGGGSQKNAITRLSTGSGSGDNQMSIDSSLILQLLQNNQFQTGVANMTAGVTGSIVANTIASQDINVGNLIGTSAQFDELFTNYLEANTIAAKLLTADNVQVNNQLSAKYVTADALEAQSATIEDLAAGAVTADRIIAGIVSVEDPDDYSLLADSAFIQYLNSGVIDTGIITTDTLIATMANLTSAQVGTLTADTAFIQYLNSGIIDTGIITTDTLIATMAELTTAQVGTLTADTAFFQKMQAISTTTINSVVDQQYVHNLVAGNISVADLSTHTATADQIVLISSDGSPAIAFSNATQQFYDEDGNVRVQIGQDGNGDFNFIVRGADGTTALFNENGITQNGIPNNTIVNNMITDSTIQKSKMGFNIAEANADGTINITNVKDGSGGNFGVEYTSFKQGTTDALNEINSQKMYRVVIESNNGNIFKNGDISCTLSCRVYSWDDEITDDINAANFTWTRKSKNAADDAQWNANHSGGAKTLTITSADVYGRSVFYCQVTLPDGSAVTGG